MKNCIMAPTGELDSFNDMRRQSTCSLPALQKERRLSFDRMPFNENNTTAIETMKRTRHCSESEYPHRIQFNGPSSLCPSPPQRPVPKLTPSKKVMKRSVSVPEGGMDIFVQSSEALCRVSVPEKSDDFQIDSPNSPRTQHDHNCQDLSTKVDEFYKQKVEEITSTPLVINGLPCNNAAERITERILSNSLTSKSPTRRGRKFSTTTAPDIAQLSESFRSGFSNDQNNNESQDSNLSVNRTSPDVPLLEAYMEEVALEVEETIEKQNKKLRKKSQQNERLINRVHDWLEDVENSKKCESEEEDLASQVSYMYL